MAKRFVQDVVPSGRRSIRNIPLPESKRGESESRGSDGSVRSRKTAQETPVISVRPEKAKVVSRKTGIFSRWWVWLIALVILLGIGYFVSYVFVSARVVVVPKEITTPVSVAGSAKLDAVSNDLAFTIVTLEREGTKEAPATGEEKVQKKASGKITIYNNSGTAAQQLVANTRFESSSGLIYRIQSQVSVPGTKTVNGVTTPGSITVTVYADQPGEKYNIGLSDFTIPGFKGDPRFTKITAKSDPGSPISGGYIGTVKKVTPADLASTKMAIEAQLKNDLQNQIQSQIPDTHVLFKNAATFSFTELPQGVTSSENKAMIREKGTIYGILFDKKALSKFLADKLVANENRDALVANLDSLAFTLDNANTFSPTDTKEIKFKLSGTANFVWNVDFVAVKESLIGEKRSNIKGILSNFESVNRAKVSIRPVWVLTMPRDPNKIAVEIERVE